LPKKSRRLVLKMPRDPKQKLGIQRRGSVRLCTLGGPIASPRNIVLFTMYDKGCVALPQRRGSPPPLSCSINNTQTWTYFTRVATSHRVPGRMILFHLRERLPPSHEDFHFLFSRSTLPCLKKTRLKESWEIPLQQRFQRMLEWDSSGLFRNLQVTTAAHNARISQADKETESRCPRGNTQNTTLID